MIKGWTTWDNRIVDLKEISHSHLSNIYYFINYINPTFYNSKIRKDIYNLLKNRFNGEILPYHPCLDFKEEINYIHRMGWVKPNGEIQINGEIIGSILNN